MNFTWLLAIAKARDEQRGPAPVPDPGFSKDVEAAVEAHREPLNPPSCE